uniref:Uncharacterized protein n=1 Tax=Plectus sambesii TaxID=2011161 RepID=A0A914W242_9BILA
MPAGAWWGGQSGFAGLSLSALSRRRSKVAHVCRLPNMRVCAHSTHRRPVAAACRPDRLPHRERLAAVVVNICCCCFCASRRHDIAHVCYYLSDHQ